MNDDLFLGDSLSHPSAAGTWMGRPARNTFDDLAAALEKNRYRFGCAVGMYGMDGFEPESFAAAVRRYDRMVPVAGFRPGPHMEQQLDRLCELGYRGIKLHPRFSRIDPCIHGLGETCRQAARRGLVVFFCTFPYTTIDRWPRRDPFEAVADMVREAPEARIVLLHGGDVDLLRHMQLVRFNERLLLDLSHTMMKYPGSSIDADVSFLFHHFDRRICIGVDWPQFRHDEVRARFQHFACDLDREKALNVAHRNLAAFLGLD